MPTYDTPHPIDLAVDLPVGLLEIIAGDRSDTIVTVSPTNPAKEVDRRGAERATVAFDGSRVTVTGPKPRFSITGPWESIDVKVELPSGSRVTADVSAGSVRTTGRLGATRIKNGTGAVDVEDTGDLWVRAGHGGVSVGSADGAAEITADHGQIRIRSVAGQAVVKASHGNVMIGESGGDVDAKLSYGDLDIDTALAGVSAKTAYGTISLGEVSGGSLQLETGYGQVRVGVRSGVAAWLDLSSKDGHVRNELDGDRAPDPSEPTVAVRARTQYGDITIHRSTKGTK
jgi:DUF4097 and DUF4098 domain-containing protein YvlB